MTVSCSSVDGIAMTSAASATFVAGVCVVDCNVDSDAACAVEIVAADADVPAAVTAVRSMHGPRDRAVAMIRRFREWNAIVDSTVVTAVTAVTADDGADAASVSATAAAIVAATAATVAEAPDAARGAARVAASRDAHVSLRDCTDDVVHMSNACHVLRRNRVDVAGVVLLGWTLRYRMRSTGKVGDWYATSPDGIRYRSHKELQRRVV